MTAISRQLPRAPGSGKSLLRRFYCLLLVVLSLQCCPAPALCEPDASLSESFLELQRIDFEIIKQLCRILKINTALRTEYGKTPASRKYRLLVAQTTNYTTTFTGLMINMIYNFYYYPRGGRASKAAQLAATTPRLIGKAIYLGDLSLETIRQAMEHRRELRSGFDPSTTLRRVSELKQTTEGLIEKRRRLLDNCSSSMTPAQCRLAELAGQVLKEGFKLALDEYLLLNVRARSISTRNRTFTTLTLLKKADATFGADLTRIIGGATQNRFLSAPASMSTTTSGFMSAFDPLLEILGQKLQSQSTTKKLTETLGTDGKLDLEKFDHAQEQFRLAALEIDPRQMPLTSQVHRTQAQIFRSMAGAADALKYERSRESHQQQTHDLHSIVYHAIYGGSKASRGIWLIYVGFRYRYGKEHSRHAALLNGFAGIDNFAGSAYREIDFLTYDLLQFMHRKETSVRARADSTMIGSRWDMLDTMEQDADRGLSAIDEAPAASGRK
jgi:hypothetical protein